MSTAIIIPTYNEGTAKSEQHLEDANKTLLDRRYSNSFVDSCRSNIFRTLAVLRTETDLPIIVIDDGSSDDTSEEVVRFQKNNQNHNTMLLQHRRNYGKGMAFLTAIDNLNTDITSILLTDADMIVPNNIINNLSHDFYQYRRLSEKFGMSVACCRSKQSWGTPPEADFIVESASGTRMLCLQARRKVLNEHGEKRVYDLMCGFPYGLETILNNLFTTIIASSTITSKPAKELPRFLPACRHYAHFDHVNEQICGAQNMYEKHVQNKKRREFWNGIKHKIIG